MISGERGDFWKIEISAGFEIAHFTAFCNFSDFIFLSILLKS